ncbi:hypothetical protein HYH03_010907 [Edaphochlamys debaryana]|uniref:Large ribosomal subunit protein bL9c n=1 Tax=Edaphochlamys debaryana TaxID=47281 RepID=A0A836BW96_9CHLO|nr:hypothetical protein HYH03_010907 [Edaphochlamys debaryana]|eukprot:KAG2490752.1 hypothetical protein HYH03_010907 [Edaphochlamys debaryana]
MQGAGRALAQRGLHSTLLAFAPESATLPCVEPLALSALRLARSSGLASSSGKQSDASGSLSWLSQLQGFSHSSLRGFSTSGLVAASSSAAARSASSRGGSRAQPASQQEEDDASIKVVLKKDLKALGRRGEVVAVRRGLMRHKLYPAGDAVYATPENVAAFARPKSEIEDEKGRGGDEAQSLNRLLKALHTKAVVVTRRPSPEDPERFDDPAVHRRDVAEAVLRQRGIRLHPSHLFMGGAIDSFGSFKVPMNLRLPTGEQVELTVHVDRRGGRKQAAGGAAGAGAGAAAAGAGAARAQAGAAAKA